MNNMQIILLVAIVISAISLGFALSNMSILQTSMLDQRIINNDQSQMIKTLTSQLNSSQQVIENQRNVISQLDNNITSISNEIKSLDNRISTLERSNIVIPPPTPINPVKFQSLTIKDENGNNWTSQYIKEGKYYPTLAGESCNNDGIDCFVHMSKTTAYNKTAIEVDTIGSQVHSYWFFAYSDVHVVPQNGSMTISGKFLKNDLFSLDMAYPRSFVSVFLLSEDAEKMLDEHMMVAHTDKNETWYDGKITFNLTAGQTFRIGIGRTDNWDAEWKPYASWTDVQIGGILKPYGYIPPSEPKNDFIPSINS